MKRFLKDGEGLVHLASTLTGGEYTLCGWSFDTEAEEEPMKQLNKGVVTCPSCIAEIQNCRNVKCRIE